MPDRDPLYAAVLEALGVRPTSRRRREVAQQLRQLAGDQERLADMADRIGHVPAGTEPLSKGRHGRLGARWVSVQWIQTRRGEQRYEVRIGRGLWRELGSPWRLDGQNIGGRKVLIAVVGQAGWSVRTRGIPRFHAPALADVWGLEPGKYSAEVRGSTLEIGDRIIEKRAR